MNVEELTHIIKQLASQQQGQYRPYLYGHIANYDPSGHKVRVIFPSLSDGNGGFVVSGWMPLGSISVGSGFGIQVIPYGGATQQQPTNGEQCMVMLLDHNRGIAAAPCLFYNNEMLPPGAGALPGDVIIQTKGGASVVVKGNGSNVNITAITAVDVTAPQANVTASTSVTVASPTATFTGNVTVDGSLQVIGGIS